MAAMRYHKFLRHSAYRRYGIFIISIFFSLYSIQVYVNNIGIDAQITQVKSDIVKLEEESAFMDKFYKWYLKSDYSAFFLWHENGTLYPWESIIRLAYKNAEEIDEVEPALPSIDPLTPMTISTPQQARNHFIDTRLSFLKRWGLIK